ncbi:TPA: hypothetical protein ACW331_002450, partial [Salmonella enterica subsp. enterica]
LKIRDAALTWTAQRQKKRSVSRLVRIAPPMGSIRTSPWRHNTHQHFIFWVRDTLSSVAKNQL